MERSIPILSMDRKQSPRTLNCAAWLIVTLLALNTLLLGVIVSGLAVFALRAQPLMSAVGPEDVARVTSALRAADEAGLVKNVGAVVDSLSNVHLLPANIFATFYSILGLDLGSLMTSAGDVTAPALQAVETVKFDSKDEANVYATVANVLNVGTSVATLLSSWERVNDSPHPDLGILDAIFGTGVAGSGTSWLLSQLNATALKQVSASCSVMHTQMAGVNLPSVSWKPFVPSDAADPSGKYKLVVDSQAETQHLLTPGTWEQIVDGTGHFCAGIDTFATNALANTQRAQTAKASAKEEM